MPTKPDPATIQQELDDAKAKLAALREHTLASNPNLRQLHDLAVAYLDAVAALSEVRGGAPLSTTIGWLIRQRYLVPSGHPTLAQYEQLQADLAASTAAQELMAAQFRTMQQEKEHGWREADRFEDHLETARRIIAAASALADHWVAVAGNSSSPEVVRECARQLRSALGAPIAAPTGVGDGLPDEAVEAARGAWWEMFRSPAWNALSTPEIIERVLAAALPAIRRHIGDEIAKDREQSLAEVPPDTPPFARRQLEWIEAGNKRAEVVARGGDTDG